VSEEARNVGTLYPPRTMFLRQAAGEAEDKDGNQYEVAIAPPGLPLVQSKQTGNWFALSFQDIVRLAVDAGIDEPLKVTEETEKSAEGGG